MTDLTNPAILLSSQQQRFYRPVFADLTMLHIMLRRLFWMVPTLLVISIISFAIIPSSRARPSPRCRYAEAQCRETVPELREIAPGHFVRCHLAE